MRKQWGVPGSLLAILFILLSASCARDSESMPDVWIDYPRDGDTFQSGEPVAVMSHAFARGGVAEIVLSVNGEAYRRDVPAGDGGDFVSVEQAWIPVEAGMYTLQVQSYDRSGQPGNPAVISIEVIADAPTLVPTTVETATLVPSVTAVVTVTPVITLTPVVVTTVPQPATTVAPPPPAADTTPPPVPSPAGPANGLEVSCRSTQTLVWLPVSDPSEISGYYVKLEMEVTAGQWQSAGGYGPTPGKQVDVNVKCGVRYRWMVRAQDGAGNFSSWSAPSAFSVSLN